MIRDQIDWEIGTRNYDHEKGIGYRVVSISGIDHTISDDAAAIAHCILILVDSINDSKIGMPS